MFAELALAASTGTYLVGSLFSERTMRKWYLGGATCSCAAFLDQQLVAGAAGAALFIAIHSVKLFRLRKAPAE